MHIIVNNPHGFSGLALAWLHKAASTLNVYQGRIGSSVTELEFYVSRMRNLIICYFVFKNQSHYSGVRGQRVNELHSVVTALTAIIKSFQSYITN